MKSGMLAAEAVYEALERGEEEASNYEEMFKSSWVYKELHRERNVHAYMQKYGRIPGIILTGIDSVIFRGKLPIEVRVGKEDHETTLRAKECKKIGMIIFPQINCCKRVSKT